MAKTAKTKTSTAQSANPNAAIALVPGSAAAKTRRLTPARAAWVESYREKQKIKRMLERSERREEQRERQGYFRLKERVNGKLKAFTGKHHVRTESDVKSFRLDMIALGREMAQFGERITAAGMSPESGLFVDCPRLLEAMRDHGGLVKKLEKLRAELLVVTNLHSAFSLFFYEPKDLATRNW